MSACDPELNGALRMINAVGSIPADSPMLQIRIIYSNRLLKRINPTAKPIWTTFAAIAYGSTQNDVQLPAAWIGRHFLPFAGERLKVKRRATPCTCIFQHQLESNRPILRCDEFSMTV